MRRRELITLLGGAAVTWPLAAPAQQPGKLPLIGVLVSASPPHPFADAFWRGLHALGYSEDQNIRVEFRYTNGRSDRAEEYAEEFVRVGVDVIVAHFVPAVEAAMGATQTIPIVMAPHGAPIQLGAIRSLARPGGNVTGLSNTVVGRRYHGGTWYGTGRRFWRGITSVAATAAAIETFFSIDFRAMVRLRRRSVLAVVPDRLCLDLLSRCGR
jgi:ABC transporter substrate binding protein